MKELLKSFGYTVLGLACFLAVIFGIESLISLPKPWGLVSVITLIVMCATYVVHLSRTR